MKKKKKPAQLATDGAVAAQDLMIKTVLIWFELALGTFMWCQTELFLQSDCMEVIWFHFGVQTGYILNTISTFCFNWK